MGRERLRKGLHSGGMSSRNSGSLTVGSADLTSRNRAMCFLAVSMPCRQILVHTMTDHEEASCRSVFGTAGCHNVVSKMS